MKRSHKSRNLAYMLAFSIFIVLVSSVFLLAVDNPLKGSWIRILGLAIYVILLIFFSLSYLLKRNSISLFIIAALGAQGFISMLANAAFGFQTAWLTDPTVINAIVYFVGSFSARMEISFLIFMFYFSLLLFSGVLAALSYVLARYRLFDEIDELKRREMNKR